MEKAGLIDRLQAQALTEKERMVIHQEAPTAEKVIEARRDFLETVKAVGKTRDPELILTCERTILTNEKNLHANNKAMRDSLDNALEGVGLALKLLDKVQDVERYKGVDEALQLRKNRKNGLPRDEARQFFDSNNARLLNLQKSRLSPEEKLILDARKTNNIIAREAYIKMQKQALDRDIDTGLKRSAERSL